MSETRQPIVFKHIPCKKTVDHQAIQLKFTVAPVQRTVGKFRISKFFFTSAAAPVSDQTSLLDKTKQLKVLHL